MYKCTWQFWPNLLWDQNEILRILVTLCTTVLEHSNDKNQNIAVIALYSNINLDLRWQHLQVTLTRPGYWVMISTVVQNPYLLKKIKKFVKLVKRVCNWKEITCNYFVFELWKSSHYWRRYKKFWRTVKYKNLFLILG